MLGGIFDINQKKLDLEELNLEMSIPSFWNNQVKAIQKSKEQESLNSEISKLENIKDSIELLMSEKDEHQDILDEVLKELNEIEFQKMFSSETDFLNCYIDIQAGSGGTESNDWAQMLLRMYTRWLSQKGFETELLDFNKGDVAGIKSATLKVTGKLAYGWCKFESGVHRLVRKSPFDSNNKRHSSICLS